MKTDAEINYFFFKVSNPAQSVVSYKIFQLGGWSVYVRNRLPGLGQNVLMLLMLQRQFFLKYFNISVTGILASLSYIAPCPIGVLFYLF